MRQTAAALARKPPSAALTVDGTARVSLTMEEAAEALGVSRAYAYRLLESGELRTFTLGRRRLVSVDALRALIAKREHQPTASDVDPAASERARAALKARRVKETAQAAKGGRR